jgi:hypothetical protein
MKTTHKILFGLIAVGTLALATPSANAYVRGHYVRYHGRYGYYHRHRFYEYNAGPYPYYYGPWNGPGVTVVAPGPAVVIAPRRHRFFFFF